MAQDPSRGPPWISQLRLIAAGHTAAAEYLGEITGRVERANRKRKATK